MKIGYLGPGGTFTEQAARFYCEQGLHTECTPLSSVADVFEAVHNNTVDRGVVPVENSIEGSVNTTLDGLLSNPRLSITDELTLAISQNLLTLHGVVLGDVSEVWSHPQAIAQCRQFLRQLPVSVRQFESTATAAQALTASGRRDVAVIGSRGLVDAFPLTILRKDVQDYAENYTRFFVVTAAAKKASGAKTLMTILPAVEHSGVLSGILSILAALKLNLTWIASRPMRQRLGRYQFLLDVEAGMQMDELQRAIAAIEALGHDVRVMGSYDLHTIPNV